MSIGPHRRAELTEAKRRSRAAQRQAEAEGRPMAHAEAVREALADAALITIAVGGPGSDEIMRLVCAGFPTVKALPITLRAKARSGKLRPRRLTPKVLKSTLS